MSDAGPERRALAPLGISDQPPEVTGAEPPESVVRHNLLTERQGPFQVVLGKCVEALEGKGSFVAIQGEAGLGKTRLVETTVGALTARGIPVLRAQCTDRSGRAPFLPLVEATNYYLTHETRARMQELWRVFLERHPELNFLLGGGTRGPGDTSVWTTHVYLQLAEALAQLGRRHGAIALVLDDFHFIDTSSLGFLQYLVRRMDGLHVAVLVALRPEETLGRDDLRSFLLEATAGGVLTSVELKPLGPGGVREFVALASGKVPDDATVARLVDESRGNPLYLRELVVEGGAGLAPVGAGAKTRLGDLILARYYSLEPDLQEFLRCVAVGGEAVNLEALRALGLPPATFHRLLSLAIQRGFLEEAASPYGRMVRFHHRRTQEVILTQASEAEKAALRYQFGLALEGSLGHRTPTHEVYELAHFFREGPDAPRAAKYLYLAATRATVAHAIPVATDYYGALVARPELMEQLSAQERYEVRFHLAELYDWASDTGAAIEQLSLIDEFPSPEARVRAYAWWGYYLVGHLRTREGLAKGRQAVRLGRGTRQGLYAEVMLARNLITAARFREAELLVRHVRARWRRHRWTYEEKAAASALQVDAALMARDLTLAVDRMRARLRMVRANEDPLREADVYVVLCYLHMELDQPHRALAYAARALEMARAWRIQETILDMGAKEALIRADLGEDLGLQIATTLGLLGEARRLGVHREFASMINALIHMLFLAHRVDEIPAQLQALDEYLGRAGREGRSCLYHYIHGEALAALGKPREALASLLRAQREGIDLDFGPLPADLELSLARVYVALGDFPRARRHAHRLLRIAPRERPVRGRAGAWLVLAEVERAKGNPRGARERTGQALDLLRGAGYMGLVGHLLGPGEKG